ncbi:MAG: accessory gene regulator B family protein [Defluviitaleaceae bacterium]|nr:accessory gene regulator B family protein [Defluviitaleaceae bacterium]
MHTKDNSTDKFFYKYFYALYKRGVISRDNVEVCAFGFQRFLIFLLNISTYIIIGLVFNMLLESIIFILAYSPVRIFAGGYHAKSPVVCYLLGIPLFLSVLLLQHIAFEYSLFFIAAGIIAAIAIARIAPIESPNKPLEDIEVRVYGKITKLLLRIELVLALVLYLAGFVSAALAIMVPMIILCGVLVVGRANNEKEKTRTAI